MNSKFLVMTAITKNLAVRLDCLFKSKPFLGRVACIYFDWSAHFTNFLLFNTFVYFFFYLTVFIVTIKHAGSVYNYIGLVHTLGLKALFSGFSLALDREMKILLLSLLFLFHIIMLNTILSLCTLIQDFMNSKYYVGIIKSLGYNSQWKTALKFGTLCVGCVLGVAGAEASNRGAHKESLDAYCQNYKTYVDAVKDKAVPPVPSPPYQGPFAATFASSVILEALK